MIWQSRLKQRRIVDKKSSILISYEEMNKKQEKTTVLLYTVIKTQAVTYDDMVIFFIRG